MPFLDPCIQKWTASNQVLNPAAQGLHRWISNVGPHLGHFIIKKRLIHHLEFQAHNHITFDSLFQLIYWILKGNKAKIFLTVAVQTFDQNINKSHIRNTFLRFQSNVKEGMYHNIQYTHQSLLHMWLYSQITQANQWALLKVFSINNWIIYQWKNFTLSNEFCFCLNKIYGKVCVYHYARQVMAPGSIVEK